MMTTINLSRVKARYRLPSADDGTRSRLDALLRSALDERLELVLERARLPMHEEVCIQSLHAPLSIDLATTDPVLADSWSVALADSIRSVVDGGGPTVVRYATVAHALTDMLGGVATGDFRRAWAWRQLGLWSIGDAPAPSRAASEAVRTLTSHSESIVAVVAETAVHAPDLFAVIPTAGWMAIVRAAMAAHSIPGPVAAEILTGATVPVLNGGPAGLLTVRGDATGTRRERDASVRPGISRESLAFPDRAARRIASRSAILQAIGVAPKVDDSLLRILTGLAVLEVEPTALRRSAPRPLIDALLHLAAGGRGAHPAARLSPDTGSSRALERDRSDASGALAAPARVPREATDIPRDPAEGRTGDPTSRGVPPAPDPGAAADGRGQVRVESGAASRSSDREALSEKTDRDLPALPVSVETEWGGLLFLMSLIGQLELPEEMGRNVVLRDRPLRWVLHRIALVLIGPKEAEPAAMIFAGLAPDALPPSHDEAPPTRAEEAALNGLTVRLAERFAERLTGEPIRGARALSLVRMHARRRARIAASQGWIDVFLSLDEVSVDVRRAGLDSDPGWLPWLGVVVRFIYE